MRRSFLRLLGATSQGLSLAVFIGLTRPAATAAMGGFGIVVASTWRKEMRLPWIALASVLGVLSSLGAAQAQQQQQPPSAGGTPDQMPFNIPYGTDITLERAKQLIAAAEAEGNKRGWKMNIAVVDTHGDLVADRCLAVLGQPLFRREK